MFFLVGELPTINKLRVKPISSILSLQKNGFYRLFRQSQTLKLLFRQTQTLKLLFRQTQTLKLHI